MNLHNLMQMSEKMAKEAESFRQAFSEYAEEVPHIEKIKDIIIARLVEIRKTKQARGLSEEETLEQNQLQRLMDVFDKMDYPRTKADIAERELQLYKEIGGDVE